MKKTIVIYPPPGLTDINSMIEFGKLILHHYPHNFSITFLCTHGFLDNPTMSSYIQRISNSNPSISFHLFPSQLLDTPPSHRRMADLFELIRLNLPNARNALYEISKTSNVRALIIHLFCTSALSVGIELGIPTYYFYTPGASALAVFLNLPKIHQQTNDSFKNLTDTIFQIPGSPPLKATHMPSPLLDRNDASYLHYLNYCSSLPKANGIIVNTFDGFEPIAMKAIEDGLCVADGPTPPVYYIGPLIHDSKKEEEEAISMEEKDYMSWLDKQPSRSVVFLCFGRMGTFTEKQVREIASGLENSGKRFLWVLKKPIDDKRKVMTDQLFDFNPASVLPEGFTERTRGLGVVVKSMVPQMEVLKKESVGGFVTHCGWNSVLEALVTGVPMIAWPLYAEQNVNRNALVEDMKMAIPVEKREEDGFVSGTELETRVRELMESEKGRELRERTQKMKEMSLAAFGDYGSSKLALKRLIDTIG